MLLKFFYSGRSLKVYSSKCLVGKSLKFSPHKIYFIFDKEFNSLYTTNIPDRFPDTLFNFYSREPSLQGYVTLFYAGFSGRNSRFLALTVKVGS